MIAHVCDLEVGDFVHSFGDAHIYHNHFDQVATQLARTPLPLPQLVMHNPPDRLEDFSFDMFEITNYEAAPSIKAPIAV